MRKKLIVLTTILGLLTFSGVAAAENHEFEDTGDTTFNFGYDETSRVFIWGSSASDGAFDCTLENGPLRAVYDDPDGGLLVEDLMHLDEGGDPTGLSKEFDPSDGEGDSVAYSEGGHDCELTAAEVAGPQGQVNHGMFLKTFNAMFDGQARGCMVRHIAQSNLGKDDQQIKVPDVEGGNGELDAENSIDFETVMTDCLHGPDENGEAEVEGQGNGKGRPDWVTDKLENKGGDDDSGRRGPPAHARGKGPKG